MHPLSRELCCIFIKLSPLANLTEFGSLYERIKTYIFFPVSVCTCESISFVLAPYPECTTWYCFYYIRSCRTTRCSIWTVDFARAVTKTFRLDGSVPFYRAALHVDILLPFVINKKLHSEIFFYSYTDETLTNIRECRLFKFYDFQPEFCMHSPLNFTFF